MYRALLSLWRAPLSVWRALPSKKSSICHEHIPQFYRTVVWISRIHPQLQSKYRDLDPQNVWILQPRCLLVVGNITNSINTSSISMMCWLSSWYTCGYYNPDASYHLNITNSINTSSISHRLIPQFYRRTVVSISRTQSTLICSIEFIRNCGLIRHHESILNYHLDITISIHKTSEYHNPDAYHHLNITNSQYHKLNPPFIESHNLIPQLNHGKVADWVAVWAAEWGRKIWRRVDWVRDLTTLFRSSISAFPWLFHDSKSRDLSRV